MSATIHDICDSPLIVQGLFELIARPLPDWFVNRQFPPPYTPQMATLLGASDIDHENQVERTPLWDNPNTTASGTFESVFGLIIDMVANLRRMRVHGPPYFTPRTLPPWYVVFRDIGSRFFPDFVVRGNLPFILPKSPEAAVGSEDHLGHGRSLFTVCHQFELPPSPHASQRSPTALKASCHHSESDTSASGASVDVKTNRKSSASDDVKSIFFGGALDPSLSPPLSLERLLSPPPPGLISAEINAPISVQSDDSEMHTTPCPSIAPSRHTSYGPASEDDENSDKAESRSASAIEEGHSPHTSSGSSFYTGDESDSDNEHPTPVAKLPIEARIFRTLTSSDPTCDFLPSLAAADEDHIVFLLASMLYQRRTLGIKEPAIGLVASDCQLHVDVVFAWLEDSDINNDQADCLPTVHIAYPSHETGSTLWGLFDLTDISSACTLIYFMHGLKDYFASIVRQCQSKPPSDHPPFTWRFDQLPAKPLRSISSWIADVQEASHDF